MVKVAGYVALFLLLKLGALSAIAYYSLTESANVGYLINHYVELDFGDIQDDRVESLLGGLKMWWENPVFGAGLGAYIQSQIPIPLVIHNSILWVLAEMGIFGLALFLILPLSLLRKSLEDGFQWIDRTNAILFLVLITVGAFSQFHEITYQRIIWFVLGMLVV